jgi:hypothetical protein
MAKVSVEVRNGTARFRVGVTAQSIRRALSAVGKRYPGSDVGVVFPVDPEGFFVDRAAGRGQIEPAERMAA